MQEIGIVHVFAFDYNLSMPKIIFIAITFFLVISCQEYDTYHWVDREIHYYINREANQSTVDAVKAGFLIWEKEIDKRFVYSGINKAGIRRDGKSTVSFLVKWPSSLPFHHVAYCKNWYRKDRIVESDIIFNMELVKFTTLKTHKPDSYYIEGVLIHEIGHLLGLGHIDNEHSVMYPDFSIEASRRILIDSFTLNEYYRLHH